MFSNKRFIPETGKQPSNNREYAVSDSAYSYHYPNSQSIKKRMERLVINAILTTGWASYFTAIFLNLGTFKGDILLFIGVLFMMARLFRYCLRTWQEYRKTELEIKKQKHDLEDLDDI